MVLKQESRLNGVKTNITNILDVANALRVPSAALVKFFCAEVGANQEQDSIVKGSHTIEDLTKLLDNFIARYVLCSKCKYPECAFELQKKNLMSRCNACGNERQLDTTHKAGKQLVKDMPTFYSANPEFKVRVNKAGIEVDNMKVDSKVPKKDKIISKKQTEDEEKSAKDRASKILLEGGEINALDAKQIEIDSTEIADAVLQLDLFINESDPSCEDLLTEVRQTQLIMNITSEYKYYILFCGIFQGKRNVVKAWNKYEAAFLSLVKSDGEVGIKRLMQTMVLYFAKFDTTK
jgi:translation initiation factor 2 beta subunit (eIF-2beta)/eIF-5